MAIRFDDSARTAALSVRDLVEEGAPSGHLVLELAWRRSTRAEAGRKVHRDWQAERAADAENYAAEVTVKRTLTIAGWTVTLWGRVDGVEPDGEHTIVEEVKSTPLDAKHLFGTTPTDWPAWLVQLEVYLWMLADAGYPSPIGRLVLVSLADGSRHVVGVPLELERVGKMVHERIGQLVATRERRLAWMEQRRSRVVPIPHRQWRPGQREIAESVEWGLAEGQSVLVQAPTGLGKTDAALYGALRYALKTDRQLFWATHRTTQQVGVIHALRRLAEQGLKLRSVTLSAKEKVCLNEIVSCRPDACRFAESYYDRLHTNNLPGSLAEEQRHIDGERLRTVGSACTLCPFELALDLVDEVDVVVGDVNYVFEPQVHLARAFDEPASKGWVVVVDEVHQLVERARDWFSPRLEQKLAARAVEQLTRAGREYGVFAKMAERIERLVEELGQGRTQLVQTDLPRDRLQELACGVEALGLDYALLKADRPIAQATEDDPWLLLARQTLRFVAGLDELDEKHGDMVSLAASDRLQLVCLDPSRFQGPRLSALGGFVGLSATLSPPEFYRDLLGLVPDKLDHLEVPSPFPPERRRIVVASRVSTAFKDRDAHAEPTARLLEDCIRAVPGNVAVYFPSFAMQDDLVGRARVPEREWIVQRPGMDDELRASTLARLSREGHELELPKVLCAVLGGVFAEGIDLPSGALDAVFVLGPALPPVGAERDLLRSYYEERYGQGFLYASLVPGLTRVVQAAGRLIRRPEDRGVVMLIDRRFRWRDVSALFPSDWSPVHPADPAAEIRAFFATPPERLLATKGGISELPLPFPTRARPAR
jgi:DNA excision repair protein ERCC-2